MYGDEKFSSFGPRYYFEATNNERSKMMFIDTQKCQNFRNLSSQFRTYNTISYLNPYFQDERGYEVSDGGEEGEGEGSGRDSPAEFAPEIRGSNT